MKTLYLFFIGTLLGLLLSCNEGEGQSKITKLSATEFSAKINQTNNVQLVDVRTPGEFAGGHIKNALNININGNDFDSQISKLDKNKPVFVYCLSGARSASSANYMSKLGFKEVYDLSGGMIKWRSASLPETTDSGNQTNANSSAGISRVDYFNKIKSDKLVLVDFYAEWCAPCKKMKPYLEEISNDMKNTVDVLRIDADASKEVCQVMTVEALPTLILYKNGIQVWRNTGYVTKEEVLNQINANK